MSVNIISTSVSFSGSLGVPKIKISAAVDLSLVRSGRFQIPCNQRVLLIGQRPVKYLSLRATLGSVQASTVTAAESAGTFVGLSMLYDLFFYCLYVLNTEWFTLCIESYLLFLLKMFSDLTFLYPQQL